MLHLDPNTRTTIRDDTQARLLCLHFGLLDQLIAHTQPPQVSQPPGPRFAAAIMTDHPTHWIVGYRYTGAPIPADNGYILDCIPKRGCTLSDLHQQITQRDMQRPHIDTIHITHTGPGQAN